MTRTWVKLWVHPWLQGSTRVELTPVDRSIWIDLLAMAGSSRFPGIIASGKRDDGSLIGYTLDYLASSLGYDPDTMRGAIEKCVAHEKVNVKNCAIKSHDGKDLIVLIIRNWEHYQSDYERQKAYVSKGKRAVRNVTRDGVIKVTRRRVTKVTDPVVRRSVSPSVSCSVSPSESSSPNNHKDIISKDIAVSEGGVMGGVNGKTDGPDRLIDIFAEQYRKILGVPFTRGDKAKLRGQARKIFDYTRELSLDTEAAFEYHRLLCTLYFIESDEENPANKLLLANNHGFGNYVATLSRWAIEAKETPLIEKPEDIMKLRTFHNAPPKVAWQINLLMEQGGEVEKQCFKFIREVNGREEEEKSHGQG